MTAAPALNRYGYANNDQSSLLLPRRSQQLDPRVQVLRLSWRPSRRDVRPFIVHSRLSNTSGSTGFTRLSRSASIPSEWQLRRDGPRMFSTTDFLYGTSAQYRILCIVRRAIFALETRLRQDDPTAILPPLRRPTRCVCAAIGKPHGGDDLEVVRP
jgi:hypothetical protein